MTDPRDPILRTVPGPADLNSNGHIFGDWVLSQMDQAGGIVAGQVCGGRCATVAIESMQFIAPIHLRDLVSVYATVERRGRTSVAIRVDVVATRSGWDHAGSSGPGESVPVTSGLFTFVALDDEFRPRPLPG